METVVEIQVRQRKHLKVLVATVAVLVMLGLAFLAASYLVSVGDEDAPMQVEPRVVEV